MRDFRWEYTIDTFIDHLTKIHPALLFYGLFGLFWVKGGGAGGGRTFNILNAVLIFKIFNCICVLVSVCV